MGVIVFWVFYIISGIVLYHILGCLYVKGAVSKDGRRKIYNKTNEDKRLKHPLWLVLVFILVFFIPFLNIIVLPVYLGYRVYCDDGNDKNPYYCKSIFTKEY